MGRISYVENCVREIVKMSKKHFKGSSIKALELFAGNGDIITCFLAKKCETVIGWEINKKCSDNFLANVPNGKFIVRNSVTTLLNGKTKDLKNDADIIFIDNPLGNYGDNYYEHFAFFDNIWMLVHKPCILAIDIIKKPYNIEDNTDWVNERRKYYNINTEELNLDFATSFYEKKLQNQGLLVKEMKIVCREIHEGLDYFYMIICAIEPRKHYCKSSKL